MYLKYHVQASKVPLCQHIISMVPNVSLQGAREVTWHSLTQVLWLQSNVQALPYHLKDDHHHPSSEQVMPIKLCQG